MGQSRALGILDAALALVGDQDGLLVKPGRECMLQSLAAHIAPADRLTDYILSIVDGSGDTHLVPAQAPLAVLGTPLMRVVPEAVLAVIRHDIRIILLYAEVCGPFPVPLEARLY